MHMEKPYCTVDVVLYCRQYAVSVISEKGGGWGCYRYCMYYTVAGDACPPGAPIE